MDFHKFYFDNGNYDSFVSSLRFALVTRRIFSNRASYDCWQCMINATALRFTFYVCEWSFSREREPMLRMPNKFYKKATFEMITLLREKSFLFFSFLSFFFFFFGAIKLVALSKTELRKYICMFTKCLLLTIILSFMYF